MRRSWEGVNRWLVKGCWLSCREVECCWTRGHKRRFRSVVERARRRRSRRSWRLIRGVDIVLEGSINFLNSFWRRNLLRVFSRNRHDIGWWWIWLLVCLDIRRRRLRARWGMWRGSIKGNRNRGSKDLLKLWWGENYNTWENGSRLRRSRQWIPLVAEATSACQGPWIPCSRVQSRTFGEKGWGY